MNKEANKKFDMEALIKIKFQEIATDFTTGLSDSERERLAILAEECAEVQQVVMKILRHGYESFNPNDPEKKTNRHLLHNEIGDLQYAIHLMIGRSDLASNVIEACKWRKADKIAPYLHFQNS